MPFSPRRAGGYRADQLRALRQSGHEPSIPCHDAAAQRVRKSLEGQRTADRHTSAIACVTHAGESLLLLAL